MLIKELGYRPPSIREIGSYLFANRPEYSWSHLTSVDPFYIPAAVLHGNPLISYSGIVPGAPLGVASLLRGRMSTKNAWFLLSPTWTIEDDATTCALRRQAVLHRLLNPLHRIVFMCNTDGEAAMMRTLGEAAITHNKTTNISEVVFKPLEDVRSEFDAIYNAQLASWKRHELTLEIPRCAFLFYRGGSSDQESEAALIARHKEIAPGHVFVNEYDDDGVPIRLPAQDVNRHMNRASVGLCLSEQEGAMFACAEYLVSGIPVVTTPNRGGRDFYVDDDYCITAAADPRDIASAVAALKSRGIPRQAIRERTMQRVWSQRTRFIDLINAIYAECGVYEEFRGFWPPGRPVIMEWTVPKAARKRAVKGMVDEDVVHR